MINAPAKGTPLVATNNPLRKQTLLGIAPVAEPPGAGVEPPVAEPPVAEPPVAAATPAPMALPAADNPLRKQTLLGIAPVMPAGPKQEVAPATEPASAPSIVTPAALATDAPTTTDLPEPPVVAKPSSATSTPGAEPLKPARAALSISHDDLPQLKPRRPRWTLPLGVAAALALGVVGLRQLDHAPTPTPAELAHPLNPAKPGAKALQVVPQSNDGDDDDDGNDPNAGNEPTPDPTPPGPEPLKTKPGEAAKPSATAAAAPGADSAAPASTGSIRINIESDPPHARMFWKGKEVGTTPFVLELQPGEKHAYELGLPGYTTRKVVIDGSKTDISIGLRPEPTAPIGGRRGKL